jgi:LysM domain
MNQRVSAPARAFAVIALVCGFLIVIVVVAGSLGGDGDSGDGSRSVRQTTSGDGRGGTPKSYVVQNGDTLTSIAHKTGVSVVRIQTLNPGVDPQILISGEKLKLR